MNVEVNPAKWFHHPSPPEASSPLPATAAPPQAPVQPESKPKSKPETAPEKDQPMATSPIVPVPSTPPAPAPAVTPAPVKKSTFLSHFKSIASKVFHFGEKAAEDAEPIIAVAFPNILPIYNSTLNLAMFAETKFAASSATGLTKLASVTTDLIPQAEAWAKANGITWNEADITKWSSAVVDTLNMIPAPTQPLPTPPPVTTAI